MTRFDVNTVALDENNDQLLLEVRNMDTVLDDLAVALRSTAYAADVKGTVFWEDLQKVWAASASKMYIDLGGHQAAAVQVAEIFGFTNNQSAKIMGA